MTDAMTPALELAGVQGRYGLLQAVKDLSLTLQDGAALAVIGANGAGKTTLMRMIAGLHPAAGGQIGLFGQEITGMPAHERVRAGLALCPEGRRLFADLTVRENLMIAAENGRHGDWSLATVADALPQIAPLMGRPAGGLSGGQRQAVAIGRALIANPRVLLLDEVSLGLSPVAVDGVYQSLARLKGAITLVIVEQDLTRAMGFADRLICMAEGVKELEGPCAGLTRAQVTEAYFGIHKSIDTGAGVAHA